MTIETRAITTLQDELPDEWFVELDPQTKSNLTIGAPPNSRISFELFTTNYQRIPAQDLLKQIQAKQQQSKDPVLFLTDYIGPSLRRLLTANGINFADTTGWISIQSQNPMALIRKSGADRSPSWLTRQAPTITRLNGPGAGKVMCALAETNAPVGIRELADLANVSPGTAAKVVKTLTSDGVTTRDDGGRITRVEKRALIERWVQDYGFLTSNTPVQFFIAPRGVSRTLEKLQAFKDIAFTGSVAARALLPEGVVSPVPLQLIAMYASNSDEIAQQLRLIPADKQTYNLVIATPQRPEILSSSGEGIPLAPTPLVLADLLTLPNRGNSEANQLMNIFTESDPTWSDYGD